MSTFLSVLLVIATPLTPGQFLGDVMAVVVLASGAWNLVRGWR